MLTSAMGYGGAVTAPHRAAALAGRDVLEAGGTAIEAMVAAAAAIAVAYPHMNGIGGDGFWIIHRPGEAPVGHLGQRARGRARHAGLVRRARVHRGAAHARTACCAHRAGNDRRMGRGAEARPRGAAAAACAAPRAGDPARAGGGGRHREPVPHDGRKAFHPQGRDGLRRDLPRGWRPAAAWPPASPAGTFRHAVAPLRGRTR